MGKLEGKVAFITGGARGQGAAVAQAFAREGADIIITDICAQIATVPYDLSSKEDLESTAEQIRRLGRGCVAEIADVRDQGALDAAVARGVAEFGGIDIVCANAGIQNTASLTDMTDEQWDDMLGTNLKGVWHTVKATAPQLIKRQSGSVILTASASGHEGANDFCHYTAAKHGVLGLAKCFALELGPHNVRVNSLLPGPVDSYMINNQASRDYFSGKEGATKEELTAVMRQWHVLRGHAAVPLEGIANAALWLASDDSAYVHGLELVIDSGHMVLPGFNHAPIHPEAV
jgi:SDR family mycofactocin-dependent oxidoreductase